MKKGISKRTSIFIGIGGLFLSICLCVGAIIAIPTPSKQKAEPTPASRSKFVELSQENTVGTIVAETLRVPTATAAPIQLPIALEATETEPAQAEPTQPPTQPPASLVTFLEVDFIDVGQGDAILLTTQDGKVALIDGGEQGSGALQYLQAKGINHIDLMIATHPHSDHIGGLVDVLKAMPVSKVLTNGQMHTTQIYENFIDAIANAKAEYVEAGRGDTLSFSSLTFEVLNPTSVSGDDINNNSLVLRLPYKQETFLFMGDAGSSAEASILASGLPIKADVLKVGHHGSGTSTSAAFLNQVKPSIAVYSAGTGNPYGHPKPGTIARLESAGVSILGTDVNGTVAAKTGGSQVLLAVSKDTPRAPPVQPTATGAPAQAGPLALEISTVTSPVAPNATATLQAKTSPGANCTITVYYKSGPSSASGLGPQAADANGNISWSWKVGNRTTPGIWRIVVTASLNGQSVTQETTFTVQ